MGKSHTLRGDYLNDILTRGIKQGKGATYIVVFTDHDVTATITLSRRA